MKKIIVFAAVICLAVSLQAQVVINDANAQPRKLDGSFSAIKISGGIDLYLAQSNEEGMAVSASSNDAINSIKTKIENGTLVVSVEGTWFRNPKFRIYVSVKNLDKIHASGASDVHVQGKLKLNTLKLELSGASNFKGEVDLENFDVHQSGASDLQVSGKAVNTKIEASGASDIKGYDLDIDYLTLDLSGASDAHVTVNKELNVKASGASDVRYRGEAVIKNFNVTGAASLKKG